MLCETSDIVEELTYQDHSLRTNDDTSGSSRVICRKDVTASHRASLILHLECSS
jgi:hypothetical protein